MGSSKNGGAKKWKWGGRIITGEQIFGKLDNEKRKPKTAGKELERKVEKGTTLKRETTKTRSGTFLKKKKNVKGNQSPKKPARGKARAYRGGGTRVTGTKVRPTGQKNTNAQR